MIIYILVSGQDLPSQPSGRGDFYIHYVIQLQFDEGILCHGSIILCKSS